MMSRWCDQSIHDAGHSDRPNGHLFGRSVVWNPCRGNHLGQRSCASAPKGRTYGRKRSDQSTAKTTCEEGAVHIWVKQFRAIATRYDKTARNFLAACHMVAALCWLN